MPHVSIQDPEEKAKALTAAADSQAFKDKMGYLVKLLVGRDCLGNITTQYSSAMKAMGLLCSSISLYSSVSLRLICNGVRAGLIWRLSVLNALCGPGLWLYCSW